MILHGIEYAFCRASSVTEGHDSLGLECSRGDEIIFEIFRNDETLKLEVTLFERDVPLELLEYAVPAARELLGDFMPYLPE